MANDCRCIAFLVMLDMTPYAVQTENCYPYQLAAVISRLENPENDQGHYMKFLRIFRQWIRFNDTAIEAVDESAALHENFPETDPLKLPLSCSMWQTTKQIIQ
jgi:hypothetical protein